MGLLHLADPHRVLNHHAAALPTPLFELDKCPFDIGLLREDFAQHERAGERSHDGLEAPPLRGFVKPDLVWLRLQQEHVHLGPGGRHHACGNRPGHIEVTLSNIRRPIGCQPPAVLAGVSGLGRTGKQERAHFRMRAIGRHHQSVLPASPVGRFDLDASAGVRIALQRNAKPDIGANGARPIRKNLVQRRPHDAPCVGIPASIDSICCSAITCPAADPYVPVTAVALRNELVDEPSRLNALNVGAVILIPAP
jgi:hypothetical protein